MTITNQQLAACAAEVPAYSDIDAYVSDLALSSIWGDGAEDDIPAQRIEDLRSIYTAVKRPFKEIIASSGLTQKEFAYRFCIPLRSVENWASEVTQCTVYIRLLLQESLGLFKR